MENMTDFPTYNLLQDVDYVKFPAEKNGILEQ
jgi:hypothetical protein